MCTRRRITCGVVRLALIASVASPLSGQVAQPKAPRIDVLFIGNSYTYYNDLPGMLRAMAAASHDSIDVNAASVVEGGASLRTHWNRRTIDLIRNGDWDYVVLQEQSLAPLEARDEFMAYGMRFARQIRAAKAKPVLYLTWSRQQRPADQSRLNEAYGALARETDAIIVPVGPVWQELRELEGVPGLYADDGSHPSSFGSFVAAATFYRTIFGETLPEQGWLAHGVQRRAIRVVQRAVEGAVQSSSRAAR